VGGGKGHGGDGVLKKKKKANRAEKKSGWAQGRGGSPGGQEVSLIRPYIMRGQAKTGSMLLG